MLKTELKPFNLAPYGSEHPQSEELPLGVTGKNLSIVESGIDSELRSVYGDIFLAR